MTRPQISKRRDLLVAVCLMVVVIMISGSMGIYVLTDPGLAAAFDLARIATGIDLVYQNEVDWDQLLAAGMSGMFARLDRYSGYIEPRRWSRVHEELSGSYTGIGVTVTRHARGLLIMSVREGGPANKAGLLTGDVILEVDSTNLAGLEPRQATDVLRGPEGTTVALAIYRPADGDTLAVTVERRQIDLVHIPYAGFTSDSVIYIRLLDFDAGASDDLEAALDSLLDRPDMVARGVILDLRGNPGGLFYEAYETASLFLEPGQFIVGTDGRSRWNNETHVAVGPDKTGGLPLAVIVDGGSASSAEIVAGSLKQAGRAILVGDTTFGKGLVQGYSPLLDGSAVRLTISRYYLDGPLYLNQFDSTLVDTGQGLAPDHLVEFEEQQAFPRQLERSLMLHKFAAAHSDEITEVTEVFALGDEWLGRFEAYLENEGFSYRSPIWDRADLLVELVHLTPTRSETVRQAESLLTLAKSIDAEMIEQHAGYIKRRLTQIAVERKSGRYAAYARAIVPQSRDIALTAELLRGVKR